MESPYSQWGMALTLTQSNKLWDKGNESYLSIYPNSRRDTSSSIYCVRGQFRSIIRVSKEGGYHNAKPASVPKIPLSPSAIFSVRTYNAPCALVLILLGKLCDLPMRELMDVRNMGQARCVEVLAWLAQSVTYMEAEAEAVDEEPAPFELVLLKRE